LLASLFLFGFAASSKKDKKDETDSSLEKGTVGSLKSLAVLVETERGTGNGNGNLSRRREAILSPALEQQNGRMAASK
jgi:hypothetical protein